MYKNRLTLVYSILLLSALLLPTFAVSQEEPTAVTTYSLQGDKQQTYIIPWSALDAGGKVEEATSANYRLRDAIGQPVIGKCENANYRLYVGFCTIVTVSFYEEVTVFDTDEGTYPSIMGTHNGTITPSHNINVSKLYTYACAGTGGHTESIKLYDENGIPIANGSWNGYTGDYHNITIRNLTGEAPYVTLLKNHEYLYVIKTGSYPQIIHEPSKNVTGGTITCTKFTNANSRTYNNWIPAIRLE